MTAAKTKMNKVSCSSGQFMVILLAISPFKTVHFLISGRENSMGKDNRAFFAILILLSSHVNTPGKPIFRTFE